VPTAVKCTKPKSGLNIGTKEGIGHERVTKMLKVLERVVRIVTAPFVGVCYGLVVGVVVAVMFMVLCTVTWAKGGELSHE